MLVEVFCWLNLSIMILIVCFVCFLGGWGKQKPHCLRARFGTDGTRNAVHGSDSPASASREISFFFPSFVHDSFPVGREVAAFLSSVPVNPSHKALLHDTLIKGLTELCKARPTPGLEAIRWLGQWLVTNNPTRPKVYHPEANLASQANVSVSTSIKANLSPQDGISSAEEEKQASTSLPNNGIEIQVPERGDSSIVFVVGKPGAGKTSQCTQIVEQFGYTRVPVDDLLQAEISSGSASGAELSRLLDASEPIPGSVVATIVRKFAKRSATAKMLVDGWPLTLEQAFALEQTLGEVDFLLYIDSSDEKCRERNTKAGLDVASIERRFKSSIEELPSLLGFYEKLGKLRRVDGNMEENAVVEYVRSCFSPHVVFVLGGPGSGKKTQCKLMEQLGYRHLSLAELVQQEVDLQTSFGKELKTLISDNRMIPSQVALQLINRAIVRCPERRFVLDGFPRTLEETIQFERTVGSCACVILLEVCKRTRDERLLKRSKEPQSRGRALHLQRLRYKLQRFGVAVGPLIDYYEKIGKLRKVAGDARKEDVFTLVRAVLKPKIVFVLGGPGSGKGTQCDRIKAHYGYTHLSAGFLYLFLLYF